MNQTKLTSSDIIDISKQMIETGYMKHEVQEHLIDLGVSFAEAHETVENLYRYNAKNRKSYASGRNKRRFWRFAIAMVS